MVAKAAAAAEIMLRQSLAAVQYHHLRVSSTEIDSTAAVILSKSPPSTPVFSSSSDDDSPVSLEISRSESALGCSTSIQTTTFLETPRITKFLPTVTSGSYTSIGPRDSNEDEHLCIDDLQRQLGPLYRWPVSSSFYGVFDGHGGSEAATFLKDNALKFFFQDALLLQRADIDDLLLEELEDSHRKAFLVADQALAAEEGVDSYCGTTALTVLVLGRHLLIANAGDCRAVLCRKGVAVQLSQDHRPSCVVERKRVEDLGGFVEFGYLNGELAVTRALGDWHMKCPNGGSQSPLTAEPEMHHILLTEEDEFLIIGCDGIWDVMSNQDAVRVVRREIRQHGDPEEAARELVDQALMRDTTDNLTVVVVCFTSPYSQNLTPHGPGLRNCSLSGEARKRLRSLLD